MKFIKGRKNAGIPQESEKFEKTMKIGVSGMTCNHCKASVEKSLAGIDGVNYVNADPQHSEVIIRGDNIDLTKVKDVVENIGFGYKGKFD